MARSFGLVDYKVQEAEYFLRQLHEKSKAFNFGDIQFTTSAFVSATRSITFAMQGSLKGNTKFDDWYAQRQAELRGDALAKFFHDFRTVTQHLGINVVGGGAGRKGFHKFYFVACPDLQVVPEQDVLTACEAYFTSVLSLVFECYEVMGPTIHGQWYFTEQHFASQGLGVEDAEEELGFPRGWTDIGRPNLLAYRWELLRRQADGCLIDGLFVRWLGRELPKPQKLPPMPQ